MFEETQSFREMLVGAYLSFIALQVFIFIAFPSLSMGALALIVIIFAAVSLLYFTELHTRTEYDGIHIRFSPFHRSDRVIEWDEIENFQSEKYKPMLEFGGWGIRWRPKKIAYNVRGNEGVRITKKDGKQVLIGSQKAERLEEAIKISKDDFQIE